MVYTFSKPKTSDDYEAMFQLMDEVFGDEDVRGITKRFIDHPEMNSEHFLLMKKEEQVVASLLLIPQTWLIGEVGLRVAEMGCVGTHSDHRRKGLQAKLSEEFDKYAVENGFDMCVLAGIPFFYRQFGYQYAIELNHSIEIPLAQVTETETDVATRKMNETDLETANKLLVNSQKKYFVRSYRTPQVWRFQLNMSTYGGESAHTDVFLKNRTIVGYCRYLLDNEVMRIKELVLDEDVSLNEIATVLKREAEKGDAKTLRLSTSFLDRFSEFILASGGRRNTPYAWQVKIVDEVRFLSKLRPELERRLHGSEYRDITATVNINFWRHSVKVPITNGRIGKIEKASETSRGFAFNPYVFPKLALGYKSREELVGMYPDVMVSEENVGLVDVLFPKGTGFIHYNY